MKLRTLAALAIVISLPFHVACGSLKTRYYMAEGNKLYKGERYEEAIEEYRKIVAFDPANWAANYQIAMSYLAMYHPGSTHPKDVEYADKATVGFETLLTLQAPDPDTAEKVRNYYIALLRSADKTEKVVAYYIKLIEADPTNGMFMSQLAEVYAKAPDFPNALKWYSRRTEVEPNNKEAWYTVGVLCWERSYRGGPLVSDTERVEVIGKGMEAIGRAMQIDPEYFEAMAYEKLLYLEKSKVLSAQGMAVEAGEAYMKADEVNTRIMELLKKRKAQAAPAAGATPAAAGG